ncbi:rRNA biogenesis protein rrp5 [Coemansia sp. RSA 1365]|nr:rRNA biogenesis protein rrp5 [Coemansia sp. RSA 1365]
MAGKRDKPTKKVAKVKTKDAKQAASTSDFPRGGANGLTPLEFREIARQAEHEVLFSDGVTGGQTDSKRKNAGGNNEAKSRPKKSKSSGAGSAETDDRTTDTILADSERVCQVESLSLKKLTKGALVFGTVSAIYELELRVSLPNGLVGFVPITSVSPELTTLVEKAAEAAEDSDSMEVDKDGDCTEDDALDLSLRFFIGQFVKCVVVDIVNGKSGTAGKKGKASRVELTLMPAEINSRIDRDDICEGLIITSSVKSVEDRGYVLNTGIPGADIAAFLPVNDAQAWIDRWTPDSDELKPGQLVEAAVTGVSDDRRSLRLSIDPMAVSQATAKETHKTMASVQPGQLVSATIMKVWDRGLSLRFMGFYDCCADLSGIGMLDARDKADIGVKYPLGSTLQVRVIYVSLTAAAKVINVSVLPHVLALSPRPRITGYETPAAARLASSFKFSSSNVDRDDDDAVADKHMWPIPYGTILDDCTVAGTVGSIGLALRLSATDAVTAFALATQLVNDDQPKPTLHRHSGQFHIGTRHRARVIGYDAMDAIVRVSLRPSVIDEQLFTINDARPGAVVSGTVVKFRENGVEIALSPTLGGFVHKQDLSDITLKHPELHFAVGKRISCRVLKVISKQHSILLTARKSLVQSKLPIVTGYTEAEGAVAGIVTHAVVDRALKGSDSVIVRFYQGVNGLVARGSKQLTPGKLIKCRLLSSDPEKRRILATANVDPDVSLGELAAQAAAAKPKRAEFSTDMSQVLVGQIVSGTVVSVGDTYVMILLDGSLLGAALPVGHFSDHVGTVGEKRAAEVKVNTRFDEMVITGINTELSRVTVSAKPALIKAGKAGRIPSSTAEITAGKTLVGWISRLTSFGAFVAFSNTASALAPLEHLSDRYVSAPEDLLSVNQTVIAFVTSVEESADGKRVRVSLKDSAVDVAATDCIQPVDFVTQYFNDLEGPDGSALLGEIGQQAQVKVKQRHPYGVVVSPASGSKILPKEASGFITAEQAKDNIDKCKEGAVVGACVLDVDPEKSIIDYSLRTSLVIKNTGKSESKAKSKANAKAVGHKALEEAARKQQRTQAVVEVVKEDYLVLSLPLLGNAIAFAMAKTYNDRTKPFMRFKIGQTLRGTPVRVAPNRRTLVLLQTPSSGASTRDVESVDQRAVKEPVDPAINFFEDYQPGLITQARVRSIKGMQANLDLAMNVKGRLHITELVDEAPELSAKTPGEVFDAAGVQIGKVIRVRVLGWHDANVYKFLPITHRASPMKTVIETTIRPSCLAAKTEKVGSNLLSWKTVKPGQVLHGFVKGVKEQTDKSNSVLLIALGVSLVGHLRVLDATGDYEIAAHPARHFTAGTPIEVQVSGVDKKNRIVFLVPHGSSIANIAAPVASLEQLHAGTRVVASVAAIMQDIMFADIRVVEPVSAAEDSTTRVVRVSGRISAFDSSDTLSAKPFSGYTKGQLLDAVVVDGGHGSDPKARKVQLSVRPSALQNSVPVDNIADPPITSAADVSVGQVVRGFVKSITEVGCFVSLGRSMVARALISELSDEYVRDVKGVFAAGTFVTGVVTSVDAATNRVGLSLRSSRVGATSGPNGEKKRRLDQIGVGESLRGTVTRIEDYGVFVRPDDAFATGLCYVREIADSESPVDPKALYEIGDRVLAKVLKVDVASDRLALGLKSSYFVADSSDSDGENDSASDNSAGESGDETEESNASDSDASGVSDDEDSGNVSSDDGMDVDDSTANPALAVAGGFRWGDEGAEADATNSVSDAQEDIDGNASDDEEGREARGTSNKSGRQSKMQRLAHDVTAELSEQAPRSANDFERLVMGSPNSSFVWIQFMTFYLGQSEIAQARQVAERALKTISPREEQEKMNVWMALLNLEHRFGSSDALDAVLKRAIQFMNPKHVYLQMASVHERAGQFADAERMHKLAVAKFPGSCKVWVLFGLLYLKQTKVSESRDLLARALRALPDRKHVKAISQFAQMEFKHGEPERGRTVFEGVLASFPKRVDLWSVYLDMEISAAARAFSADAAATRRWAPVRSLFERVIAMKLSSKKVKSFFKKWLKFEKDHGSEATVEHVKQRAREYVGSLAA